MQFRLTIILFVLFFFAFFLSLLLGLLVALPVQVVFLRAIFSGLLFVAVGFLLAYIYKKYLSCTLELSQLFTFSPADTNQRSEVPFEGLKEEDIGEPVNTQKVDKDTNEAQEALQGKAVKIHKLVFPSFSQLKGEDVLSTQEPEGLTKLNKNSFEDEDPSLMAEAIRTVIAKGGQGDKSSKTQRSQ